MRQINPPFDRSEPCPACQQEVRAVSALIHNFLNRCDIPAGQISHGKAMVKLVDLRATTFPDPLTVPHPVTEELMAVGRALVEAISGIEENGLNIRWTPEIRERVGALIQRAAAAEDAFRPIADAHFADERHCSGTGVNILRESRGYSFSGHLTKVDGAYNYTVDVVSEGGDLTHEVCGTQLKLHEHFRQKLAIDPQFYGLVYCPSCRSNCPEWQFKRLAPC